MNEETQIAQMKRIILNLSEWLNTPNDELENMIGCSWMAFHDLLEAIEEEE